MTQNHPTCRLIVLQYNRRDLLERFLPSIINAAAASPYKCSVTVLDNCSQDDSVEFVKKNFPSVDIFVAAENKVLCSFNDYVAQCTEDIVILLNNDMELDRNFVAPLVEPFTHDSEVFFTATEGDRAIANFRYGLMAADIYYHGFETLCQSPGPTLSAGVAAFDRLKYLELGGFDELYLPGRYEDVDLCYRGWKRGWKGLYVPESKKMHLGGASFDKTFTPHATQTMVFRNAIIFTVKNITDPALLFNFAFWIPVRLLGALLMGKWFIWSGFFQALQRLPAAAQKRISAKAQAKRADSEIIRITNQAQKDLITPKILSRKIVNFLGLHPWLRKIFLCLGFFTLRLAHPVEYLILRELSGLESVLDLGCGRHSMVPIIPTWIYTMGVEIFEPDYQAAVQSKRHKRYSNQDILTVDFPEKSFDAVVLLDVLEHLPKEKGAAILKKVEKIARKKIIIFTPNGFLPQNDFNENPYMDHLSGWEVNEFKSRGFKVYGVRGLKSMYKNMKHEHSDGYAHSNIQDYGQILTYHFPEKAFQLFCVKDLS